MNDKMLKDQPVDTSFMSPDGYPAGRRDLIPIFWFLDDCFLATHQSPMGSSQLNYLLRIFPLSDASWLVLKLFLYTLKYPLAEDSLTPGICVPPWRLSANGSACLAAPGYLPSFPHWRQTAASLQHVAEGGLGGEWLRIADQ